MKVTNPWTVMLRACLALVLGFALPISKSHAGKIGLPTADQLNQFSATFRAVNGFVDVVNDELRRWRPDIGVNYQVDVRRSFAIEAIGETINAFRLWAGLDPTGWYNNYVRNGRIANYDHWRRGIETDDFDMGLVEQILALDAGFVGTRIGESGWFHLLPSAAVWDAREVGHVDFRHDSAIADWHEAQLQGWLMNVAINADRELNDGIGVFMADFQATWDSLGTEGTDELVGTIRRRGMQASWSPLEVPHSLQAIPEPGALGIAAIAFGALSFFRKPRRYCSA